MDFEAIFTNLKTIKERYENNDHIVAFISKEIQKSPLNTLESILTSYDLQSGSYINYCESNPDYVTQYTKCIADLLAEVGCKNSVMEVGCGEATTLSNVLNSLPFVPKSVYGFDISLSRLSHGKFYFNHKVARKPETVELFCADMFNIPLADNSVEVVYTSHSIEPNGGAEENAIKELYRVASSYLILIEPSYENNSEEGKKRMDHLGYVKNLKETIQKLNLNMEQYYKFPVTANPLNPTWAHVIKKGEAKVSTQFHCPYTQVPLERGIDTLSAPGLLAYPIISGIPYLLKSHAILAAKLHRTFI